MKGVMNHFFSKVPNAEIQRSVFDRSHGLKTTLNAGDLVPIFVDEALPGDTFDLNLTAFARLSTPIFPIMDNLYMDFQFFAVPLRLLWSNFQKFMGEQDDPGDSVDFTIPIGTSPAGGYAQGTLSDYFGIPTKIQGISHSILWHRAYNLIYNEWYRDENLQDSAPVFMGNGPDNPVDFALRKRGKRHDYFTSCLPWTQKGPAVGLPLGISADIKYGEDIAGADQEGKWYVAATNVSDVATHNIGNTADANDGASPTSSSYNLIADLTTATASTINQLRQAFQLQKLYERDARGGTRYTEIIRAHFGVSSPDERLQRPEYLGGGSTPVNISAVAQISSTDGTSPQGNLAALGTVAVNNNGFVKSFTEHCVIIGIASVRADLTYSQGLPRMFSRSTKHDFYWPALAHIGEQAVLNKEIYTQGVADPTADAAAFGYQERFAEYRYGNSKLTGFMRHNATGTLNPWHLSQEFGSLPLLDDTFIKETPPMARIEAVPSEPDFIYDSYISLKCTRPMPIYGVPGLIDHF